MKYKKKPVVIEAVQFNDTVDSLIAIQDFMNDQTIEVDYSEVGKPILKIPTPEGVMTASLGDFIIKGVKGEFYPCKPDIFEQTYSKVNNESTSYKGFAFGEAIQALKNGDKVARTGWNGKSMFLFLLPEGIIPKAAIHDPALKQVLNNTGKDHFEALGSIRMKTADDKILTGWLASQTDMLAEDWVII